MNQSRKSQPHLRKLPLQWLSDYKPGEKEKKEDELRHYMNSWPFIRLIEILNKEKKELTRSTDYTNPSWAYQQAHNNGRLQQIDNVLHLLEGKQ